MPTRQFVVPLNSPSTPADWTLPASLEIIPRLAYASFNGAAAAGPYKPVLRIISDSGHVAAECVSEIVVAAGGSADVSWFPGADLDEPETGATAGVVVDQFLVDSKSSGETSGSAILTSGVSYLVTVQGTWSLWNHTLEVGTPNADAIFPSSTAGRVSLQVGLDSECCFAFHDEGTGFTLGHKTLFQLDAGSGLSYVTAQGGPYAIPQPNYLYRYTVTGQGSVLKAKVVETGVYTDNYGKLQVTVYGTSGSSTGGGGGSLIPPDGADYAVLQPLAGVYSWNTSLDGGSA